MDLDGVSVMGGVSVIVPGSTVSKGAAGVSGIGVGWIASVGAKSVETISAGGKVISVVARSCMAVSDCAGAVAGSRYWQPAAINMINAPTAKKQYKFLLFTKDAPEKTAV